MWTNVCHIDRGVFVQAIQGTPGQYSTLKKCVLYTYKLFHVILAKCTSNSHKKRLNLHNKNLHCMFILLLGVHVSIVKANVGNNCHKSKAWNNPFGQLSCEVILYEVVCQSLKLSWAMLEEFVIIRSEWRYCIVCWIQKLTSVLWIQNFYTSKWLWALFLDFFWKLLKIIKYGMNNLNT